MSMKVICPIEGLQIQPGEAYIQFEQHLITGGEDHWKNLVYNDDFFMLIGIANAEKLRMQPFRYGVTDQKLDNLGDYFAARRGHLNDRLNFLWLIKDNAIYTHICFLYDETSRMAKMQISGSMTCNASGTYEPTTFGQAEIDEVVQYIPLIEASRSESRNQGITTSNVDGITTTIINESSLTPYNVFNRLERAWIFLGNARTTSLLAQKISFYIATLECLFFSGGDEIKKNVSNRAAYYIGGDYAALKTNSDAVKIGYDVRSDFLHGRQMEARYASKQDLVAISKGLDDLLREIFKKAFKNDTANFLLNDRPINVWFDKLTGGKRFTKQRGTTNKWSPKPRK